jgi:hypothetical protein
MNLHRINGGAPSGGLSIRLTGDNLCAGAAAIFKSAEAQAKTRQMCAPGGGGQECSACCTMSPAWAGTSTWPKARPAPPVRCTNCRHTAWLAPTEPKGRRSLMTERADAREVSRIGRAEVARWRGRFWVAVGNCSSRLCVCFVPPKRSHFVPWHHAFESASSSAESDRWRAPGTRFASTTSGAASASSSSGSS